MMTQQPNSADFVDDFDCQDVLSSQILLKCPGCSNSHSSSFSPCSSGHFICQNCHTVLIECPVCSVDLPNRRIRNKGFENILDGMTFDCYGKVSGCMAKLKPSEMDSHRYDCSVGQINYCEMLGIRSCVKVSSLSGLVDHLKDDHFIEGVVGSEVYIEQGLLHNTAGSIIWYPTYLQAFDTVFFLGSGYNRSDESFYWAPTVANSSKTAKKFWSKISLSSPFNNMKVEWEGPVFGLNENVMNPQLPKFTLPADKMKHFKSNGDDISFGCGDAGLNVSLWKLKLSIKLAKGYESDKTEESSMDQSEPPPCVKSEVMCPSDCRLAYSYTPLHFGTNCNICGWKNIQGARYKCVECPNFNLCMNCEKRGNHSEHLLMRMFYYINNK